jgi:hypothetical protein
MKNFILLLTFIILAGFSFAQDYTVNGAVVPPEANGNYIRKGIKNGLPWYENSKGFYLYSDGKAIWWIDNEGKGYPKNGFETKTKSGTPESDFYSALGIYEGTNGKGPGTGYASVRVRTPESSSIPISLWALGFGALLIGSFIFFRTTFRNSA